MNLIQLEAFLRVADSGSFSQAAKEMYLTQPTVSAHISSLEKELNARLFDRTTKRVTLSDQGRLLYRYAYKMLEIERKITQEFTGEEEEKNHLSIAASTIPAQYILPQVLPVFSERYPQVEFSIVESDSQVVIRKVLGDEVEVGITGTKISSYPCQFDILCRDQLVVITPNTEKFQALKKKGFPLEELLKEPLIMREEGSGTRKEAQTYLTAQGVDLGKLKIIASMSNQETILRSVGRGLGISIISSWAAKEYDQEGRILTFGQEEKQMSRELYLVHRKGRNLPKNAKAFMEFMKKAYKNM